MAVLREKIIEWKPGTSKKKYRVVVENKKTKKKRTIQFGSASYKHYKDNSPLGLYTKQNHLDKNRRRRYFLRHSGVNSKREALTKELKASGYRYTPKILSHKYLW
jgi:hypothetical protein